MSLGATLNDILKDILIKDEDRAPYTFDWQKLCNELMEDLQKLIQISVKHSMVSAYLVRV